MSELEEILKEVARKALGLPAETPGGLSALKKDLCSRTHGLRGEVSTPVSLDRQPVKGLTPEAAASTVEPTPPSAGPAADDQDLWRRLRESEQKFRKKADEAEKLRAKLAKEEKARQEAESARGRAEQEAALLRKELSRALEGKKHLGAELARLQAANGALEERVKELESTTRAEPLEARLQDFKDALPAPFPPEVLLRVLVLDYPGLGGGAEERVMALIEGYRAFLKGEDHPALFHSNRDLLVGQPEGVVLVGLERLLLDLASLPLARWLRTHAFRLEALLGGQALSSPRLREE
ncbi:MAG: hypothetical protein C4327_11160 [Meiothermus sp.]